jgi:hypothetical protein
MGCTDCTKAYKLIELPVGSSKDAVKSARKEWSKNLHPDIWQNRPGWKGAARQLTNINVAIDHLLQCDGVGSYSYASSGANPKSVSEAEVWQVVRRANEVLRHAMEAMRKANNADQRQAAADAAWRGVVERYQRTDKGKEPTEAQHALKTRTKGWMFAGFGVLFVLPLFLYLTTTLFSSGQVDASDQEPTSFILQPSGIPQSDASASSPTQPAPVVEERATLEKDVEQPEEVSINSSPASVNTAAPEAPASMASPPAVPDRAAPEAPASTAVTDEAQLKVETFEKYCGVNPQEWNLSCQKRRSEVSVSFRPAYVPVKIKVVDHQVASDMAPTIRNQYGVAQRIAPFGYAAIQQPEAQPISRANTLILSNGTTIYVTNVWYSGERVMFTMPNGSRLFLGLEQVNFRSTIRANHQIGVNFNTPPGYPGN